MRDARRTLPGALRDVLRQEGVEVHVIAVVDTDRMGRDDGSAAWLHEAADGETRLTVLNGPGQGAAAALQLALEVSLQRGRDVGRDPLVSHMEADDRCPPDRLRRLAAGLHEGLDGITSRATQFGARTQGMRRYLDWQNGLLTGEQMAAMRFVEIPALHQTGLYRGEALAAVGGYRSTGPWPVDIDFWLRWFEHERPVAKLPAVLYRWRQHGRQSTRSGHQHDLASLRAAKVAGLARLFGGRGRQPTPLHLVSTGKTLEAWATALAEAGVAVVASSAWRPGTAAPERAEGSRFLAVYGTPAVRERLARELPEADRSGLIFAA